VGLLQLGIYSGRILHCGGGGLKIGGTSIRDVSKGPTENAAYTHIRHTGVFSQREEGEGAKTVYVQAKDYRKNPSGEKRNNTAPLEGGILLVTTPPIRERETGPGSEGVA